MPKGDPRARDPQRVTAAVAGRVFASAAGVSAAAAGTGGAASKQGRGAGPGRAGALALPIDGSSTNQGGDPAWPLHRLPRALHDTPGWRPSVMEGLGLLTAGTALLLGLGLAVLRRRGETGPAH